MYHETHTVLKCAFGTHAEMSHTYIKRVWIRNYVRFFKAFLNGRDANNVGNVIVIYTNNVHALFSGT